jgi:Domain of unknown function (DUF4372)
MKLSFTTPCRLLPAHLNFEPLICHPAGKLVLAQLMEHLPPTTLRRCVARYGGHHKIKRFTCLDQYLSVALAQLTFRETPGRRNYAVQKQRRLRHCRCGDCDGGLQTRAREGTRHRVLIRRKDVIPCRQKQKNIVI